MNHSADKLRVAVIGGGIAGLSAAFRLREEMRTAGLDHELVLYERRDTCGGATRTDHVDGFSLDHGPNGWLSNEPLTGRLLDELGIADQAVRADPAAAHRFVFTRNKLYRLPDSPGKFLTTGLLRPWEKIRVLGEYLVPPRGDDQDETIYDFGCRRFGRGFTETMLDPMVSGIFAGDAHQLSLPATFPKMRAMEREQGGMFRALFARRKASKRDPVTSSKSAGPAGPGGVLTTLKGGTGRLTETLSQVMTDHIRRDRAVTGLTREGDCFQVWCDGEKSPFDAVVMAVPAHQAAGIISELSPPTARSLSEIQFASAVVVCHMYDRAELPETLNGFGHLIPRRDGIRALGCLWTSCIFPDQAPDDRVLLRTILGGAHDPGVLELSDDGLIDVVVDSTAATLGIRNPPRRSWVFRHPRGIAQYTLGHLQRVAAMERLCSELPGLAFVGASYRGVALNRCIRDAYTVAPRVLERFGVKVSAELE